MNTYILLGGEVMKKKIVGLFFIISIGTCGIVFLYQLINKNGPYINIQMNEMKIQDEKTMYVAIYSEECISCRKLASDIEQIKEDGKLPKDFKLYGINLSLEKENSKDILDKYKMKGVPFILKYENGKLDDILVKDMTDNDLEHFFNQK